MQLIRLVNRLITISIFAIAMGFMESAVVIYLREIIYPAGFQFPLVPISPELAKIELLRETATILMLLSIGIIAGRSFSEKFAWFIYSFAIWDIFYYVFLKIFIDWPESFMTWDILFLIPAAWVGPVITPILVSLAMILLSFVILYYSAVKNESRIIFREWAGLITGSVFIILGFIWDYSKFILNRFSFREIFILHNKESILIHAETYLPESFNWALYSFGMVIIAGTIAAIWLRLKKMNIFIKSMKS